MEYLLEVGVAVVAALVLLGAIVVGLAVVVSPTKAVRRR